MITVQKLDTLVRRNLPRHSIPTLLLRMGGVDEEVRARFLAFVDVLPSLKNSAEVSHYIRMYLGPVADGFPPLARAFFALGGTRFACELEGALARWFVESQLAPHFIIENEEKLRQVAAHYERDGASLVVDLLGEQVVSQQEADAYMKGYLKLIQHSPVQAKRCGELDSPHRAPQIALKFSSLYPYFGPENYEESKRVVGERFAVLVREAQRYGVALVVDAEHYQVCRMSEDIFLETLGRKEFIGVSNAGIALQAYRKDARCSAKRLVEAANERGAPFMVRLIKGAYWDTELICARQNGWPFPLFERKSETDSNFLTLCEYFLAHQGNIHLACGTHNPASIAGCLQIARALGLNPQESLEFQVLYGLGEPVRGALCSLGLPVRVYAPVGDMRRGMAYFARRILENTANDGFMTELLGLRVKGEGK